MSRIEEIAARLAAATPGPWMWRGQDYSPRLQGHHPRWGTVTVMDFVRSGMQWAQPRFRNDECYMDKGTEIPVYEVCRAATSRDDPRVYRRDIVGYRNPDAEFIAHAPDDIAYLLAELAAIREAFAGLYIAPSLHGRGER